MSTQHSKGALFLALHAREGAFVLPNPWNAGGARILASFGYEALATTSAGFAHSLGRPDGGVTRDEALAHAAEIVAATDLPVSADLERGFGDSPDDVAATISGAAAVGLAGCSIEDATGDPASPIYESALARDRIEAAVDAARALPFPFTLTARAENYLHGRPDLDDTITRLQAFQEAGADVLYAPGLGDLETMRAVVAAVDRPVNVLAHPRYTVAEMSATGAKRISIGSHFSKAAMGALMAAAREVIEEGTFTFTRHSAGDLDALFSE